MSCIVVHKTNISKSGLGIFQYGPQIHRSPEQNNQGHKYLVLVWGHEEGKMWTIWKESITTPVLLATSLATYIPVLWNLRDAVW